MSFYIVIKFYSVCIHVDNLLVNLSSRQIKFIIYFSMVLLYLLCTANVHDIVLLIIMKGNKTIVDSSCNHNNMHHLPVVDMHYYCSHICIGVIWLILCICITVYSETSEQRTRWGQYKFTCVVPCREVVLFSEVQIVLLL